MVYEAKLRRWEDGWVGCGWCCAEGIDRNWYVPKSARRIVVCISTEPVRGAIRVERGSYVYGLHHWLRRLGLTDDSRATRDYWWWVEIPCDQGR